MYNVNIYVKDYVHNSTIKKTVRYYSIFAAVYMAKDYYRYDSVLSVEVINTVTGEVIYYHTPHEEYEAES